MEYIVKSLGSIFEKISEFFDLFDLSFFVSGATASSAIFFWMYLAGKNPLNGLGNGWQILVVVLTFYISGLVCFAVGRWFRTEILKQQYDNQFDRHFRQVLEVHGLAFQEYFKKYLDNTTQRGIWRLYTKLWAEVRQCPELAPSFLLLKRYWVMAATYDGVAFATFIWIAVFFNWCLGYGLQEKLDWIVGVIAILLLAFIAKACMREAGRYVKYQIEELVASIAVQRAIKS
jgi:hypothetical protein